MTAPCSNAYLKDMTKLNEWKRRREKWSSDTSVYLFCQHMDIVGSLLELLSIGNSWWRTKAGCLQYGDDGIVFLFSFILQPNQVIGKCGRKCRKIQHIFLSFSDVTCDCTVHICLWPSFSELFSFPWLLTGICLVGGIWPTLQKVRIIFRLHFQTSKTSKNNRYFY